MKVRALAALVSITCLIIMIVPVRVYGSTEANAFYGSTPVIDGVINSGEWSDADNFASGAYAKQDGRNLYIAVSIDDTTYSTSDWFEIFFDVNNDRTSSLLSDDLMIGFDRSTGGNTTAYEYHVVGGDWSWASVSGWVGNISYSGGWQLEFSIQYAKINVAAGNAKNIGFAMIGYDSYTGTNYYWPDRGPFMKNPSLWGSLYSTPYNWVPEISSVLALSTFMILTLLAVMIHRRRRQLQP